MPVPVLTTVTLKAANGLPEDNAQIDFTWNPTAYNDTVRDDIAGFIESFFTTVQTIPGTDHAVADWIGSAWLAQGSGENLTIAYYGLTGHLDGSDHGSPADVVSLDLDHAGSPSYPGEVAVAISMHADLSGIVEISGATRPAARRRGRVFMPWIVIPVTLEGVITGSTTYTSGVARPSQSLQDTFAAAATLLCGEGVQVWSRADAAVRPVVGGWVDNAFDTQRRRGPDTTARTIWTV